MLSVIKWLQSIFSPQYKETHPARKPEIKTEFVDVVFEHHPEPVVVSFEDQVNVFLKQFQYDPQKECLFIYHEGNLNSFQCVLLLTNLAIQHHRVNNLFTDDDTIVYFTTFSLDEPALISFFEFTLRKAMCVESFSICGSDGGAILQEIVGGGFPKGKSFKEEAEAFREKVIHGMTYTQFDSLCKKLYHFSLLNSHENVKFEYTRVNAELNLDIYDEMCAILHIDAGEAIQWKSEFNLFNLIKKHFKDAIYQYRVSWLGAQSIDIYIPSLKIGVEYQGVQHYKPVERFGGEEAFQRGKVRDTIKKDKCAAHNMLLLEWPYWDAVSEGNLRTKFEALGIPVPDAEEIVVGTQEKCLLEETTQINDKAIEYLKTALLHDNLAFKLYQIKNLAALNDIEEIKKIIVEGIRNFSEHKAQMFFNIILAYDRTEIYQAICNDDILTDYWVKTGNLNFYGRKLFFTMIHEEPNSYRAAKCLKRMRTLEKKRGIKPDTRLINNLLRNEAADNGISAEQIRDFLSKSY